MLKKDHTVNIFKLVILLFVFILYGNTLKNGFALDDEFVTSVSEEKKNLKVEQGIKGLPEIFTSHYITSRQQTFEYRPLAVATFAVEYEFFGSNARVSHLINVLLYAATCLLLFSLLLKLLKNFHRSLPFFITLLFLFHPMHTEVVGNIKSRDELLTFLFGLLALSFSLRFAEQKKWVNIFIAFVFIVLALLCKKTAILFLILIPATLYFFTSLDVRRLITAGVILLFTYGGYMILKAALIENEPAEREFVFFENPMFFEKGILKRTAAALNTSGYYLRLLILPHPLSSYYGFDTIPLLKWASPLLWFSLIAHSAMAFFAIKGLKQKSLFSFGVIVYFAGLAPFLNFLMPVVGIVGDRFVYFASLGFCIILAVLLSKVFRTEFKPASLSGSGKFLFVSVSSIVLLLFAIKVVKRNTEWKDLITLFRNDVQKMNRSANMHYVLGNALYLEVQKTSDAFEKNELIEESRFHFKEAAALMQEGLKNYPNDFTTTNNLGKILADVNNDCKSAIPLFKSVIATKAENTEARYNLAYCMEKTGSEDSAISQYEQLIRQSPTYFPGLMKLGELYLKRRDYDKYIPLAKKTLSGFPDQIKIYVDLGNVYMLQKDTSMALSYFEQAVNHAPNDKLLAKQVAEVFKAAGDTAKARRLLRQ